MENENWEGEEKKEKDEKKKRRPSKFYLCVPNNERLVAKWSGKPGDKGSVPTDATHGILY
jgi:hypothetical protein